MANDLNSCSFIGRLGAEPDARYMANGDIVISFRIACGWKTKDKEGAEWVSITAFGKLAEICQTYLKKGSQVFVSGRMQTDEYEKDGIKRYSTKIVADKMQMLGSKSDGAMSGSDGESESKPRQQSQTRQASQQNSGGAFMDDDLDIPF